jgi:hypothetical protein
LLNDKDPTGRGIFDTDLLIHFIEVGEDPDCCYFHLPMGGPGAASTSLI